MGGDLDRSAGGDCHAFLERQDVEWFAAASSKAVAPGHEARIGDWRTDGQARGGGFVVPGDVAIAGQTLWLGFWNGSIHRLTLDGPDTQVYQHNRGVSRLAVLGETICFCDSSGRLWIFSDGEPIDVAELEPNVRSLKSYPESLLAIGENRLYQIEADTWQVFDDSLPSPVTSIAEVFDECQLPVLIDAVGRGARCDRELEVRSPFLATPGAIPTSADDAGNYCVFWNPDDSRTVLDQTRIDDTGRRQSRIVFSHVGGTLAVSRDGTEFAVGDDARIRLLPLTDLQTLFE